MKRETITYKGKNYHRYPESKRRQLRVYYWRHDQWKQAPIALHRQLYIDNFGEIPIGYIVHHKDENPLNNAISNLEIMSRAKHAQLHSRQEYRRKISKKNIKKAQEKAKAWHHSPAGKAWHRKNGKKSWAKKALIQKECVQCGEMYTTFWKNALYCKKPYCGEKYRKLHRASTTVSTTISVLA